MPAFLSKASCGNVKMEFNQLTLARAATNNVTEEVIAKVKARKEAK